MDRLEGMTVLLAAVDAGSLSAASRQLRLPLATISRRVSQLEEHLGVRLLIRGSRKLVLTDAGRGYVASCRRIMEEVAEAERMAAGEYQAPQGELIISAPQVLGRTHAIPIVVEFLRAFPEIRIRVQLTDSLTNLLEEHVDLALRVGDLPDSGLIAKPVGQIRQVLCASPSYLKSKGVPQKPEDLVLHDCVVYDGHPIGSNWGFRAGGTTKLVEISSRLAVNSTEAAVTAATAGAGIARVLSHQIDGLVESRSLVRLLESYEPSPIPVNLIYPGQRQVPLKLRAFLDFSIPLLRARLGYESNNGKPE